VGRFDSDTHVLSLGATYSTDNGFSRFKITATKYAFMATSGSTVSLTLCEIDPDALSETCGSAVTLTSSYSAQACAAQLSEQHFVLVYKNTAGAGESVLATISCDGDVTVSTARPVDNFVVPGYSEQWASSMTCVGMSSTTLVYAFQDRYAIGPYALAGVPSAPGSNASTLTENGVAGVGGPLAGAEVPSMRLRT
jgi:hypothetical protein